MVLDSRNRSRHARHPASAFDTPYRAAALQIRRFDRCGRHDPDLPAGDADANAGAVDCVTTASRRWLRVADHPKRARCAAQRRYPSANQRARDGCNRGDGHVQRAGVSALPTPRRSPAGYRRTCSLEHLRANSVTLISHIRTPGNRCLTLFPINTTSRTISSLEAERRAGAVKPGEDLIEDQWGRPRSGTTLPPRDRSHRTPCSRRRALQGSRRPRYRLLVMSIQLAHNIGFEARGETATDGNRAAANRPVVPSRTAVASDFPCMLFQAHYRVRPVATRASRNANSPPMPVE